MGEKVLRMDEIEGRAAEAAGKIVSAIEAHEPLHRKIAAQKQQHITAGSRMKTRKSTRTRQRIIDAAKELIDERGTIDFQMSEVAARCSMSKGALYYYFKNRSQILSIVNDEIGDGILRSVQDTAEHAATAMDALKAICESFSDALSSNAAGFSALMSEFLRHGSSSVADIDSRYSKLVRLVRSLVDRGKDEGYVSHEVDTDLCASSIIGMFMFAAMAYFEEGSAMDKETFSSQLMNIVVSGIGVRTDA